MKRRYFSLLTLLLAVTLTFSCGGPKKFNKKKANGGRVKEVKNKRPPCAK